MQWCGKKAHVYSVNIVCFFVYVLGDRKHHSCAAPEHMYTHTAHTSACVLSPFHHCVCLCVWVMHVHISIQTTFAIHSSLLRALSQSLPTYTALFFCFVLFSSVHCFGLQLLYLFRLTGGLALPLGFRMGNGVAENGVDNRRRQGLDHSCYPPSEYYSTIHAPLQNK